MFASWVNDVRNTIIEEGRTQNRKLPKGAAKTQKIREAYKLARVLNMPYTGRANSDNKSSSGFSWDGKVLRCKGYSTSDILHDIAHFQCSPPSRRYLPEFGLGSGFDTSNHEVAEATMLRAGMDEKLARKEEECASILGALWERHLGLPYWATLEFHSWIHFNEACDRIELREQLEKLYTFGLIDERGNPQVATRV